MTILSKHAINMVELILTVVHASRCRTEAQTGLVKHVVVYFAVRYTGIKLENKESQEPNPHLLSPSFEP